MNNFKEFILEQQINESIRPKQSDYGNNYPEFDNKQWSKIKYLGFDLESTILKSNDRYVIIDISTNNNIVFRTYPFTTGVISSEYLFNAARWDKSRGQSTSNAADVFSRVFYVVLNKFKNKKFSFSGQGKLASLYHKMVNSNIFQEELNKHGFKIESQKLNNNDFEVYFTNLH